jgi:hypothetical protein
LLYGDDRNGGPCDLNTIRVYICTMRHGNYKGSAPLLAPLGLSIVSVGGRGWSGYRVIDGIWSGQAR